MRRFETIKSRDNQRLKFARHVRDGRESSYIFIEGRRLVDEALRADLKIKCCFTVDGAYAAAMFEKFSQPLLDIFEVPERFFNSISDTKQSQGIILIAERPSTDARSLIENKLKTSTVPIVIFLHEVNNPSNLGAVIRTVEAAGAAGVITSMRSADVFSARSLRAAMGSAFRLPVWANADWDRVNDWATSAGLIATASDPAAATDHTKMNWRVPRLLICGSEAHGLSNFESKSIEETVRIAMEPQVESLNLAVSAGIILFEARRQMARNSINH